MKRFLILPLYILVSITAIAQNIGSKVTFSAVDGKTYTGTVKEIQNNKYRVKYDGVDFEAWLQRDQFTMLNGNQATNPVNAPLTAGTKVKFNATDGKAYTGTILQVLGDDYKIDYDGVNFQAWLHRDQFTIMSGNTAMTVNNNTIINDQPQKNGVWIVGDKVEAYDIYYSKWENATIIIVYTDRTPQQWRVSLDEPAGHNIADFPVTADNIRARGAKANTGLSLNSRVDVYYNGNTPKGRGTIIEVLADGRYKIRYDGCAAYRDETLDWSQVKPASVVTANDPGITAVMGKWAMFVYSYPNTVVKGNDVYREYGSGAKAPPLQINNDGTYVWYDEYNKPPVNGNWNTHARIIGLTTGTEAVNGILIKDSRGILWKVYKDRPDHIEARKMCSGETEGGSRIK
jgi:hypothetical protein